MARTAKKTAGGQTARNNQVLSERQLEKLVGRNVRNHRKQFGLTVADLASAADISRGMLSKIENGQISPSLNTLHMLENALRLPAAALFASTDRRQDFSVVRAGEGIVTQRRGTKAGFRYQALGHNLTGTTAVEPYLVTLPKESESCRSAQHDGAEFIYVLTGEMDYACGERHIHLKPGDAVLCDGATSHGPEKLTKPPVTYLSVIIYPRRQDRS